MKKGTKQKKFIENFNDNKGSVMLTVLVAFLFVSVLVAIVMSTITVNFQMRAIDRKTKDEFYYAEKALNDIYTGLGQNCSNIMGQTYNEVLNSYRGDNGYIDEQSAYDEFVRRFVKSFSNSYTVSGINSEFPKYIVKDTNKKGGSEKASRASFNSVSKVVYYTDLDRKDVNIIATINNDNVISDDYAKKVKAIVIKDVVVLSNPDAQENIGYVSQVTTDIVVEVPRISFVTTNDGNYDVALMANLGVEVDKNAELNVKGNMYAGTAPLVYPYEAEKATLLSEDLSALSNYTSKGKVHKEATSNNLSQSNIDSTWDTCDYGGIYVKGGTLNISDADYIVSGGDIYVDSSDSQNGIVNINQTGSTGYSSQIWFENIEIKGNDSNVKINGNLFAANDLQIDGKSANVKIEGSYYGYNDGKLKMEKTQSGKANALMITKEAILERIQREGSSYRSSGVYKENPSTHSSSIIINGKNANLDMTKVNTLMLAGNAYIDHESNTTISIEDGKISINDLPESVAIKASQSITLMPQEFIYNQKFNPNAYDTAGEPFVDDDIKVSANWFGAQYLNSSKSYKVVKVKSASQYYAYCYLNFKDNDSKNAYMRDVVEGISDGRDDTVHPTTEELRRELLKAIKVFDSKVEIGNPNTKIYANGSILGYDGTDIVLKGNTENFNALAGPTFNSNLYKRYRLLDTYMEPLRNRAMSANVDEICYSDMKIDLHELPLERFFWLGGCRKAGTASGNGFTMDGCNSKLYIFRDISSPVNLSDVIGSNNEVEAFVIIDGDAYVDSSQEVKIRGFIACTGKITVKENAKLSVTFDSSIINKRISYELKKLNELGGYHDSEQTSGELYAKCKDMLIYYLLDTNIKNTFKSESPYEYGKNGGGLRSHDFKTYDSNDKKIVTGYRAYKESVISSEKTINTDYNDFSYFVNWRKGQQ